MEEGGRERGRTQHPPHVEEVHQAILARVDSRRRISCIGGLLGYDGLESSDGNLDHIKNLIDKEAAPLVCGLEDEMHGCRWAGWGDGVSLSSISRRKSETTFQVDHRHDSAPQIEQTCQRFRGPRDFVDPAVAEYLCHICRRHRKASAGDEKGRVATDSLAREWLCWISAVEVCGH